MFGPTFLVVTLNAGILVLCGFVCIVTGNPLSLLGLALMQQIPVFPPNDNDMCASGDSDGGSENAHTIGFNAILRSRKK